MIFTWSGCTLNLMVMRPGLAGCLGMCDTEAEGARLAALHGDIHFSVAAASPRLSLPRATLTGTTRMLCIHCDHSGPARGPVKPI